MVTNPYTEVNLTNAQPPDSNIGLVILHTATNQYVKGRLRFDHAIFELDGEIHQFYVGDYDSISEYNHTVLEFFQDTVQYLKSIGINTNY